MNDHSADRPHDRDLTSPVDIALARAMSRAGDELGQVPAEIAHAHLDAITALAATHTHQASVPAVPAGWRTRLRRVVGLTAVKVALGAGVAAAATTGGLAATGNLPGPVQQVVSDGARRVGIQLPQPSDPPAAEDQPDEPQGTEEVVPTPPAPPPPPPTDDASQDTGEAPDPPVTDSPPEDRPVDDPPPGEVPGSPPAGPPEQDPGAPPQPRPEPEPTPGQEHSTPAAEASPSPRSPAVAPAAPTSEEAQGDEGDAGPQHAGQVGDSDSDGGGRTPAAG